MRKLLLLDADVTFDLHTLGLFGKISKTYDICLTRTVFEEARYYKKDGAKFDIDLKDVAILNNVDLESLRKVQREAKEARLGIDPGESTSIAYLIQTDEEITFCSCDQAAIKLISYMELWSLNTKQSAWKRPFDPLDIMAKTCIRDISRRPSKQPLKKERR